MKKPLLEDYEVIVASDVSERDGIGIEIWKNNVLLLDIFRDDTTKKFTISLFERDLPLELIEKSIIYFKKEIPQDFLD
jgi:hypothetical protein